MSKGASRTFTGLTAFAALLGSVASGFASESRAVSAAVFGPAVYTRVRGAPVTQTATFNPNLLIHGPYSIVITTNGKAMGHIALNGIEIFRPNDFARRQLVRPVEVEAINDLEVLLLGSPGSSVTVSVVGYQYEFAADYPAPSASGGGASPLTVDWRVKGVVGSVADQGACQADWAFSATGAIEAAWAIAKGALVNTSEQQLIDCLQPAIPACGDASPAAALQHVTDAGGITTESAYPYTATVGSCQTATAFVTTSGSIRLPIGDDAALQLALATMGPVAVVLDTSWFDTYVGGVAEPVCGVTPPTFEAALVVGYGVDAATSLPYYVARTSRGTAFGEGGYFRIVRGANACGIANYAVVPII